MPRYLHEVEGLQPLREIAREIGVVITARGGLPRRLLADLVLGSGSDEPDLFELTPFMADINLTHSGAAEQSAAIMGAINREVPMAQCFRWELRSETEDTEFRLARAYNAIVPLLHVSISTSAGIDDPLGARADLLTRNYRFVRNPAYTESPLYRANRDLEVFGALLYLRSVLEVDGAELPTQPSLDAVRATFEAARSWDTRGRLQESVHLRRRLHHLLKALGTATHSPNARALVEQSGLIEFVEFADADLGPDSPAGAPEISSSFTNAPIARNSDDLLVRRARFSADLGVNEHSAITASQHLRGDLFRLPSRIPFFVPVAAGAATESAGGIMATLSKDERLAEGIEPVRVSSWLRVAPGRARSIQSDGESANEMIHFALVDSPNGETGATVNDEDLSVLIVVRSGARRDSVLIAAPLATCTSRAFVTHPPTAARVRSFRLACGSLFEQLAGAPDRYPLHIAFMVAVRRIEDDVTTRDVGVADAPLDLGGNPADEKIVLMNQLQLKQREATTA
ncbi:MAG: hypothetical protein ABIP93_15090 [Gemmatimonadaceae bacterium]